MVVFPRNTDSNNDMRDSSLWSLCWAPGTGQTLFIHNVVQSSQRPFQTDTILSPILQLGKLMLEEVKAGIVDW